MPLEGGGAVDSNPTTSNDYDYDPRDGKTKLPTVKKKKNAQQYASIFIMFLSCPTFSTAGTLTLLSIDRLHRKTSTSCHFITIKRLQT